MSMRHWHCMRIFGGFGWFFLFITVLLHTLLSWVYRLFVSDERLLAVREWELEWMGINHWEWEGMGLKETFSLISSADLSVSSFAVLTRRWRSSGEKRVIWASACTEAPRPDTRLTVDMERPEATSQRAFSDKLAQTDEDNRRRKPVGVWRHTSRAVTSPRQQRRRRPSATVLTSLDG